MRQRAPKMRSEYARAIRKKSPRKKRGMAEAIPLKVKFREEPEKDSCVDLPCHAIEAQNYASAVASGAHHHGAL